MPYVAINTSLKLTEAQKEKIKTELGQLITIIPSKTEAVTMVDFSEGRTLYKAGVKIDGAMIDLRLWRKAEIDNKKKFVDETFQLLSRELGLKPENMYLNISEFEEWGSGGILKH